MTDEQADRRTRSIPVRRTARYFLAGDADEPREIWFVLHGYGQLARDFLSEFEHLQRPGRLFVAPEGLSRFYAEGGGGAIGASWMTKEARREEIDDYVAYLDAVHAEVVAPVTPADVRVVALGFSQGGATAFRWATLGTTHVDRLISWAGGVPPDLDLCKHRERLETIDVALVVGSRDHFVDEARLARHAERLRAGEVTHRVLGFDGGHRLDRETLQSLADEA